MRNIFVAGIIVFLGISNLFPCSQAFFKTDKKNIIARNMDWETPEGNIVINERDVKKVAFGSRLSGLNPMNWVSKYGSLTFNLTIKVPKIGKISGAAGGINEKGLYVGCLVILDGKTGTVKYEEGMDIYENNKMDLRPKISSVDITAYLLDNSKTVDEAIAAMKKIKVVKFFVADFHWFVSDKQGNTAILEYNNGELKVYKNAKVMTNYFYHDELEALNQYKEQKSLKWTPEKDEVRYVMVERDIEKVEKGLLPNNIETGFQSMNNVKTVPISGRGIENTDWTEVYDVNADKVYLKSFINKDKTVKEIDLNKINFEYTGTKRFIDIHENISGNVNEEFTVIN